MTLTLVIAAILAGLAGILGVRSIVTERKRTRWTILLMIEAGHFVESCRMFLKKFVC